MGNTAPQSQIFHMNQRVKARYDARQIYYPGRIVRLHNDCIHYDVKFDDSGEVRTKLWEDIESDGFGYSNHNKDKKQGNAYIYKKKANQNANNYEKANKSKKKQEKKKNGYNNINNINQNQITKKQKKPGNKNDIKSNKMQKKERNVNKNNINRLSISQSVSNLIDVSIVECTDNCNEEKKIDGNDTDSEIPRDILKHKINTRDSRSNIGIFDDYNDDEMRPQTNESVRNSNINNNNNKNNGLNSRLDGFSITNWKSNDIDKQRTIKSNGMNSNQNDQNTDKNENKEDSSNINMYSSSSARGSSNASASKKLLNLAKKIETHTHESIEKKLAINE